MNKRLEKCPFCGYRETMKFVEELGSGRVVCVSCFAKGPSVDTIHDSRWKTRAEKLWNTRRDDVSGMYFWMKVTIKSAAIKLRKTQPGLSKRLRMILEDCRMKRDLSDVFEAQKKLNEAVESGLYTVIKTDESERQKWMLRFENALRMESAELVDSIPWKWWKKQEPDWENVKVELVDMLHFWVSMCTVAGLEADDVIELYFRKNELNHKRNNNGYKEGTYVKYDENGLEDNVRDVLNSALGTQQYAA